MKEETKKKLNDFIRFAKSDETFFTLPYGKYTKTVFFSVSANGLKAIYAGKSDGSPFNAEEPLKLMAIVKDSEIYIFDHTTFGIFIDYLGDEPLEGVTVVDYKYMDNTLSLMSDVLLGFYADLQENENLSDPRWISYASETARKYLLLGFDLDKAEKTMVLEKKLSITSQDIIKDLSGIKSLKSLVRDKFLKDQEYFENLKSAYIQVKTMCEDGTADVEDYELQIGAALKGLKAVNVTVTFTINGRTAETKISLKTLQRTLIARDTFSKYYFFTYKAGEKLFRELAIEKSFMSPLSCAEISMITYGKKTIYERKI